MRRFAIAALAVAAASAALAHGPSRLKVSQSVTVAAPPAKVWDKIRDFNGLPAWHPAVATSAVSDGNQVGSVRTLTLKGGGQVVEELEAYDESKMLIKYRMKPGGALPVTNYAATLQVKPAEGGQTVVEWKGGFYRGYPNNDPPPDQNDEAAEKAITGVYQSGLANLKQLVEK